MKRIIAGIVSVLMLMSMMPALVACSGDSPSAVTTKALDAVGKYDMITIATCIDGDLGITDSALMGLVSGGESGELSLSADQTAILLDLGRRAISFDYSIKSETITGDTAKVIVTFTNYDCAAVAKKGVESYLGSVVGGAIGDVLSGADINASDYLYSNESLSALFDKIKEGTAGLSSKDTTYTGTISLTKGATGWKISACDDNAFDGMTGGLYSYLNTIASTIDTIEQVAQAA